MFSVSLLRSVSCGSVLPRRPGSRRAWPDGAGRRLRPANRQSERQVALHCGHLRHGRITIIASNLHDKSANPSGGFYLDQKPKDKSELVEYDFDASPTLNVPGDWNTQVESSSISKDRSGIARGSTRNGLPPAGGYSSISAAVNYEADVYLNGKKLGKHWAATRPSHTRSPPW